MFPNCPARISCVIPATAQSTDRLAASIPTGEGCSVPADILDSFAGGAYGGDAQCRRFERLPQAVADLRLAINYQHAGHDVTAVEGLATYRGCRSRINCLQDASTGFSEPYCRNPREALDGHRNYR